MTDSKLHALVFGSSGVAGWGVVNQLLQNYPKEGIFARVTALVNRPLKLENTYWPPPSPSATPSLQLVSGVNLAEGSVKDFAVSLKDKVQDIGTVTHVFYFAYKQIDDPDVESKANIGMLERAVGALDLVSPHLQFFAYITGTKGYGIHLPADLRPFSAPFHESMGSLPSPHAEKIWYDAFRGVLTAASLHKPWTWCEVRPDAIIGFVPNGSAYNLTAHWATYLSLYALVEGKGAKVPFPGSIKAWESLFNDAGSDTIAQFAIHASLHPETCGDGQLFNVADEGKGSRMVERWPAITAYFGLKGVGPIDEGKGALLPGEYVEKNKGVLEGTGCKVIEIWKGAFLDSYGFYLDFDRHMRLDRIREKGFMEEKDPNQSWFKAFDKFKEAGMIPA